MSLNVQHVLRGYHGTNEENAISILQHGFRPGREDCWVGSAIYFWESDRALALKWCEQKGFIPPVILVSQIEHSPRLLDLATKDGTDAYQEFIRRYKTDQRCIQQLTEWIQVNGDRFCDIYFIQLMFKTGVISGVRFTAMAHDEMLQNKPRTFVYARKEQEKYKSRFVINVRIVLALKDSTLITSTHRCNNDSKKADGRSP